MEKPHVLYLDDEPQNCTVFKSTFKNSYAITCATSPKEALKLIRNNNFHLIISDHRMPEISGSSFLEQSLTISPNSVRILMTGYSDTETVIQAINKGLIYQFITKPWDRDELSVILENSINKYNLELENKEIFNQIKLYSEDLEYLLKEKILDLKNTNSRLNNEVYSHKETIKNLEYAIKKSEEANEAKNLFLANMSHELRTPLHGILSFAQLGISKSASAPLQKLIGYFEHITSSGNRLLELLNNILDLAKLESRTIKYSFKPHNFSAEVKHSVREFDGLLTSNDIHINIEDTLTINECIYDLIRISQVLRNLLLNAIKYSKPSSSITIKIEDDHLIINAHKYKSVRLSIVDQGIGIPDNELETIFDKFIQSSKTNTGSGGTGLGLSICKEIIAAHHGQIWATQNKPENGSTFCFSIPISQPSMTT